MHGPWIRTWLLALVLVVAGLGSVELKLRDEGFTPSAELDTELWSVQRHKVYLPDKKPVVIVGASRISSGFDPEVIDERYPQYRAIMLAHAGRAPIGTLRDLADDEDFRGIVILSVVPWHLTRSARRQQRGLPRAYHRLTENYGYIDRFANRQLAATINDTFAFRNPKTDLRRWLLSKITGAEAPEPNYMRAHDDYSRSPDYTKIDAERHRRVRVQRTRKGYRASPPPRPRAFLKQSMYVEKLIRKIVDRGGKVVLVRFPTAGALWELDQEVYPKAEYWDRFAARSVATSVHFADYENLRGYECPDGSHLDFTDTPQFTLELAKILESLGVLDPPED